MRKRMRLPIWEELLDLENLESNGLQFPESVEDIVYPNKFVVTFNSEFAPGIPTLITPDGEIVFKGAILTVGPEISIHENVEFEHLHVVQAGQTVSVTAHGRLGTGGNLTTFKISEIQYVQKNPPRDFTF